MDSRKVVVYEFMTLDGVAKDVAGFFTEWDDHEVDAAGAAVIETQDAVTWVVPPTRMGPVLA